MSFSLRVIPQASAAFPGRPYPLLISPTPDADLYLRRGPAFSFFFFPPLFNPLGCQSAVLFDFRPRQPFSSGIADHYSFDFYPLNLLSPEIPFPTDFSPSPHTRPFLLWPLSWHTPIPSGAHPFFFFSRVRPLRVLRSVYHPVSPPSVAQRDFLSFSLLPFFPLSFASRENGFLLPMPPLRVHRKNPLYRCRFSFFFRARGPCPLFAAAVFGQPARATTVGIYKSVIGIGFFSNFPCPLCFPVHTLTSSFLHFLSLSLLVSGYCLLSIETRVVTGDQETLRSFSVGLVFP